MKRLLLLAAVVIGLSAPAAAQKVSLTPYLSVRGAGAPALSPDGEWLLFGTSVSGTAQIWKLPARATSDGRAYWPEQLTFFNEPASGYHFSPDGKWILFRKDVGGNERHQLYLMPATGGDVDSLTNNPKAIFSGTFTRDGKSVVYQSNERNEAFFDIYMMDLASRKVRTLHTSDHSNHAVALSPDQRWLFIVRDSGNANNWVFVKDLQNSSADAEPRLLTPHREDATYGGFQVSPDSKRLYLFTNEGSEFDRRAYIDFQQPNAKVVIRGDEKWDLDQAMISRDGSIEVVTRNVDGISEMTIYDMKSGKVLPGPELPEGGFISNLNISDDGSKLAFNFTSPTDLGSIIVFDRKHNKTERVTQPTLAGLDPASFQKAKLIRYPSFDGHLIPAYFYRSAAVKGKAPVIVMMHGGPESQERPWFNSLAQYYVARGYSVLIPNVRGSTGYGKAYAQADNTTNRMVSVRDMEYAARWLKTQPEVDPQKLVIYGGSYGGFMSLAAMTMQPEIWAAGVDLFGIANFHSFLQNTGAWRAANRMAEYGHIARDSAFLVEISPLTHVDKIAKPLFVYQGKNDPRVPVGEAEQIVEAVRRKGIPVEYILLDNEGHGLSKRENRIRVYTAIVDFLDRVLE